MLYSINKNSVYIEDLVTRPHNIGSGVGSSLIQFAESQALSRNKERLYLYSLDSAYSFYEKLRFSKNEYQMEKRLDQIQFETAHRLETL